METIIEFLTVCERAYSLMIKKAYIYRTIFYRIVEYHKIYLSVQDPSSYDIPSGSYKWG